MWDYPGGWRLLVSDGAAFALVATYAVLFALTLVILRPQGASVRTYRTAIALIVVAQWLSFVAATQAFVSDRITILVSATPGAVAALLGLVALVVDRPRVDLRAWAYWSAVFAFPALFASVYLAMSLRHDGAFTEELGHIDALYLALTAMTTTGFGDIAPRSAAARLAVSSEMIAGLVLIALGSSVFLARRRAG